MPPAKTLKTTELTTAIQTFEAAQKKYKQYGAYDTEPDSIFQRLLLEAFEGKEPAVPRSGSSWELYASSMDCSEAARALHDAATEAVRVIESTPIRDLRAVEEFLNKYCWRYR